jgi:hypothetical protein
MKLILTSSKGIHCIGPTNDKTAILLIKTDESVIRNVTSESLVAIGTPQIFDD